MLSSASDKAKLFTKNSSKNSNLDYSGISLPVFFSRTNLKLHNISVTPKMVKKVITNLDSSKASGPDFVPVEVIKNCEPELTYIHGFRSSRSTTGLLTVASDRIARAFNSQGLFKPWHLIDPRLLAGFGMLFFFTNLILM